MGDKDKTEKSDHKRKKSSSRDRDDRKKRKRGDEESSYDSRDRKSSRKRKSKRKKKGKHRRYSSSEDSSSSSSSRRRVSKTTKKKVINDKLLAKLEARGETLEERNARRAQKRAAHIQSTLGYTADDNPFNDPNLHETFTWKKREELSPPGKKKENPLAEIEKVRNRREQREAQRLEMQRIRDEEARMRELEGYDEFARKEEEVHL